MQLLFSENFMSGVLSTFCSVDKKSAWLSERIWRNSNRRSRNRRLLKLLFLFITWETMALLYDNLFYRSSVGLNAYVPSLSGGGSGLTPREKLLPYPEFSVWFHVIFSLSITWHDVWISLLYTSRMISYFYLYLAKIKY